MIGTPSSNERAALSGDRPHDDSREKAGTKPAWARSSRAAFFRRRGIEESVLVAVLTIHSSGRGNNRRPVCQDGPSIVDQAFQPVGRDIQGRVVDGFLIPAG